MRVPLHVKAVNLDQQISFFEILASTRVHDLLDALSLITVGNCEAEAVRTFDHVNIQCFQGDLRWFCFDRALC